MHDLSTVLFEHNDDDDDDDGNDTATACSVSNDLKQISIYGMAFIFDQQTNDVQNPKKKHFIFKFSIE